MDPLSKPDFDSISYVNSVFVDEASLSGLDTFLRWFIVTPDMHRIHHSVDRAERDNNYGFNLSWWDRIFGTYVVDPAEGQERMRIGVDGTDGSSWQTLPELLRMPFAPS